MAKNNPWTELELLIVYYLTKWGSWGCIPRELDNLGNQVGKGCLTYNEIYNLLKRTHSIESIGWCRAKFLFLLGLEPEGDKVGYNPSLFQKHIARKLANKTTSQVRKLIWGLVVKQNWANNINTLPNQESSPECPKINENTKDDDLSTDHIAELGYN